MVDLCASVYMHAVLVHILCGSWWLIELPYCHHVSYNSPLKSLTEVEYNKLEYNLLYMCNIFNVFISCWPALIPIVLPTHSLLLYVLYFNPLPVYVLNFGRASIFMLRYTVYTHQQ